MPSDKDFSLPENLPIPEKDGAADHHTTILQIPRSLFGTFRVEQALAAFASLGTSTRTPLAKREFSQSPAQELLAEASIALG